MATLRAQKILDQIKKNKASASAVIEGVPSQAIEASRRLDSANEKNDPEDKDYMTLAREHQLKFGGTLTDGMRWVEINHPHKRRKFLRKVNPGMDID